MTPAPKQTTSPPVRTFAPGDKVSFTAVRKQGSKLCITTKDGKVAEVKASGQIIIIHRGKRLEAKPDSVRHAGQVSALGEGFKKLFQVLAAP